MIDEIFPFSSTLWSHMKNTTFLFPICNILRDAERAKSYVQRKVL